MMIRCVLTSAKTRRSARWLAALLAVVAVLGLGAWVTLDALVDSTPAPGLAVPTSTQILDREGRLYGPSRWRADAGVCPWTWIGWIPAS